MTGASWQLLRGELDRWADAGFKARLWLRDDDAMEPSQALDRLNALSSQYAISITLAAIPARTGEALARYVERADLISIAVHGWSHTNYAPAGEKKQELGLHRPMDTILSELGLGLTTFKALFGERLLPVLAPPWNRIDAALVAKLPALGFSALSAFGRKTFSGIATINTHVDLIDWHGSRGCIDHAILAERLAHELAASRLTERYTVGILTHHLVHDQAAWVFLERLFEATRHPACEWLSLRQLLTAAT